MSRFRRIAAWFPALLPALLGLMPAMPTQAADAPRSYESAYRVALVPDSGVARVTLTLAGERLPSRLALTIDPDRHRDFAADGTLERHGNVMTWRPASGRARLSWEFVVTNARRSGTYDSYLTGDWAVFRGDRLVPAVRATAPVGLHARTTLAFDLPAGWSALTRYPQHGENAFTLDDPARRFERPTGWILAGRIGSRHETIAGISTIVGAPAGHDARRQDTLAFLNWNLPHVAMLFPDFPRRLLVVLAGEPMFRGGLSGPGSLFLHTDRPLVSENRSSPLLHELVHVALGIRGDATSDWIAEGLAEYYSIELLRRSGGISERRFRDAIADQARRAARGPDLFVTASTGAVTARAVTVMVDVDREIRAATGGRASLDDVARELARRRGEISLESFRSIAAGVAARPLAALASDRLATGR